MAKQDRYNVQFPDFAAKQQVAYKRLCTSSDQRLAACTSCPHIQEEAVQSANLCFQCNKYVCITSIGVLDAHAILRASVAQRSDHEGGKAVSSTQNVTTC